MISRALQIWLEEDVAYIVTPEERRTFEMLATDDERERFIERRDPTPNTAENEFKETHYLRIAYANERFASTRPGWQTDRGRMFMIHAVPFEKEFIASGNSRPYPTEVWTYRYIDGIGTGIQFEFVDTELDGEFPLNIELSKSGSCSNAAILRARCVRSRW